MIPYYILVIENDDDRAFMAELFQGYQRLMYGEIYKVVKNQWNTEDVMQAVLVKLIDKIPLLKSREQTQRINYIISTCKNTALNYVRDNAHSDSTSFEDYMNVSNSKNDGHMLELRLVKNEELDELARVWSKLDERTRHLLEGYYILDQSMEELGRELDIKTESVRMALTRARKKACELLNKELELEK